MYVGYDRHMHDVFCCFPVPEQWTHFLQLEHVSAFQETVVVVK